MMQKEVKHVIDAELFCGCSKCEEAVRDILRMEMMLCRGGKAALTRRRKQIVAVKRRPYYRDYKRKQAASRNTLQQSKDT